VQKEKAVLESQLCIFDFQLTTGLTRGCTEAGGALRTTSTCGVRRDGRCGPVPFFDITTRDSNPAFHQLGFIYYEGNFTFKYKHHTADDINKAFCEEP
jgi:hypothetical protein